MGVENYLSHHGILGQKWGVRRFQPYPKGHSGGKEIGKAAKVKQGGSSKSKKGAKSNNNKDEYRPKPKKLNDLDKEKLIRSGSVKEIREYSNQLNNNELRQALDRVDLNRRMDSLDASTTKTGMQRVESVINTAEKVRRNTEKAISMYNTGAKIYNSFADEPVRLIDGSGKRPETAEIKRLINNASADEVYNNLGKLNAEQVKTANIRLNNEEKIREKAEQDRVRQQVDGFSTSGSKNNKKKKNRF